jgi:hypothetical protein
LAEAIALSVYSELARQAPGLDKDVVLTSWLRARACQRAVRILRAEERAIDWAVLKKEKEGLSAPANVQPAPPGLAIRICQSIYWSTARPRGLGLFSLPAWRPAWIRPRHVGGVAVCVLAMIVWWSLSWHRRNPIVESHGPRMTPTSFAQLASPEEEGPPMPIHRLTINAGTKINQK